MFELTDIYDKYDKLALLICMFISTFILFYVQSVDNFFLFFLELEASEDAKDDMEEEAMGTSPEDVADNLAEATAKEEL